MSPARQDDIEQRDKALARLLAEALSPAGGATGGAGSSQCPDTEAFAAYADHGLDAEETARWESHFSSCARCQKILAVLAVTSEAPLAEQEVQRLGIRAAKVPASAKSAAPQTKASPLSFHSKHWRWLGPAIGAAAAAMLWFALRPAPSGQTGAPVMSAENRSMTSTPSPAAPRSDYVNPQSAVAPPPPAAAPAPSPAPPRREPSNLPADAMGRTGDQYQYQRQTKSEAQSSVGSETAGGAALEKKDKSTETAKISGAAEGSGASGGLQAPAEANSPMAAAAPPPAAAAPNVDEGKANANLRGMAELSARPQAKTMAMAPAQSPVFASPDGRVIWRVASGGKIERSTNQRQSWQEQSSGVTSELVAGAAPSNEVAWIVGRAGVILRTTDGGAHWARIPSPAVESTIASSYWIAIEARDALHATVVAADHVRYTTEDGGQTWNPLQK